MVERAVFWRARAPRHHDYFLIASFAFVMLLFVLISSGPASALAGSDSWSGAVQVCTSPQVSTTSDCTFTAEIPGTYTTESGESWNKTSWYRFVPATSATVYIRASSSGYDNTLHLRDSSGTIVTRNDDSYGLDAAISYALTAGSTYYVGVGSYGNNAIPSVSVLLTMSRPDAPTNVTATPTGTNGAVTVSWTAADLSTRSIQSFTVYVYSGATQVSTTNVGGSPPGTSTTVNGLTNGTAYTFKVTATNSVGTSDFSVASSSATPYAPQTVTFNTLSNKAYGDADFSVSATTNAPGATISFTTSTGTVCSVSGTTVSVLTQGTCSITATGSAVTGWTTSSTTRTFTVTAKSLSVTGYSAVSRRYDGSQSVAITGTGELQGVLAQDLGNVALLGTPTGTASSKNAGSQTVTVGGLSLTGSAATKYSLATITVNVTIDQKILAITAPTVSSRQYNGSRSISATAGTVSGYVGTETVVVTASGLLDVADAGSRTATVSYQLGNGSNGGLGANYSLASDSVPVSITPRVLTVSGSAAIDKPYDNTRTATVTVGTVGNYAGAERPVVTASGLFASATPGAQSVAVVYYVTDHPATSAVASNYQIASETLSANIAKATLTFVVTANDRAYNGSNSATVNVGSVAGKVAGDDVEIDSSKISGQFADGEPGTNKLVTLTISSGLLTGADAGKYVYTTPSNPRADISKANQSGFSITSDLEMFADGEIQLAASGGQTSGSISYAVSPSSCQLTGSRLTADKGGINCVVSATRGGDSHYNSVTVTATVRVDKVIQTLLFRTAVPTSPLVGSTYTPNVESNVFLAPTIVIGNNSGSVCSISAGVVTFNAVGTCLISASQPGSDVFSSAAASQSVTVVAVPVSTTVPPASTVPARPAAVSSSTTIAQQPVPTTSTTIVAVADPTQPNADENGELPELTEGETTVLIRGEKVNVTVTQEGGQLVMKLPNDVVIRFGAKTASGQSVQVSADGVLRAYKNSLVDVAVEGLVPGTTYTVYLFSTPIELSRGTVSADGSISQSVLLPKNVETGSHTMQVNSVGPGGEVVSVSLGITVDKKNSNTAAAVTAISIAILLALLGGRPIFKRRRRRAY